MKCKRISSVKRPIKNAKEMSKAYDNSLVKSDSYGINIVDIICKEENGKYRLNVTAKCKAGIYAITYFDRNKPVEYYGYENKKEVKIDKVLDKINPVLISAGNGKLEIIEINLK